MAITRRQFVTRLGALAGAVGFSQAEVSKLAEAFAGNSNAVYGGTTGKPKVIWIHGAECTGCSTSLLGILEDAGGNPFAYDSDSGSSTRSRPVQALGLAGVTNALGSPVRHRSDPDRLHAGCRLPQRAVSAAPSTSTSPTSSSTSSTCSITRPSWAWAATSQPSGSKISATTVTRGTRSFSWSRAPSRTSATAARGATLRGLDGDSVVLDRHVLTTARSSRTCPRSSPSSPRWPTASRSCRSASAPATAAIPAASRRSRDHCQPSAGGFDPTMSQTDAKGTYDFLLEYVDTANPAHQAAVRAPPPRSSTFLAAPPTRGGSF